MSELDAELDRLAALRDRLVQAIDSQALENPRQILTQVLREQGHLGVDEEMSQAETGAADLPDALHPHGIAGAIEDARQLLADPSKLAEPDALLRRYQALDDTSTNAEVDALTQDVAAVLPRPARAVTPADIELMDRLVGEQPNRARRYTSMRSRIKPSASRPARSPHDTGARSLWTGIDPAPGFQAGAIRAPFIRPDGCRTLVAVANPPLCIP